MAKNRIVSKTDRLKLKPRREPYWARLNTGCYLGYRKLKNGEGTWVARWRDEEGKQRYRALNYYESYDAAAKEADKWFNNNKSGIVPDKLRVSEICEQYVEHLRIHKSLNSAKDADGRFNRLVYNREFGNIELDKLRSIDVTKWLNLQIADIDPEDVEELRKAKVGGNRNLTSLKAALNFAYRNRLVGSDAGWKPVLRFSNVNRRREYFLTLAERRRLLNACPEDLRRFVTALLLTGARPGEISEVKLADFDKSQGTLVLQGKTGRRIVSLSTSAVKFFIECCKGKIGNTLIFTRSDGMQWKKDFWKKLFKKAVQQAGLPDDIVLYSLRHCAISEMISGGVDSFLVAKLTGTSTAMIDQHYGHLRHDKTREKLDAAQLL
jgi:integrase